MQEYRKQARETATLVKLLVEACLAQARRTRREAPARNELPTHVIEAMIREFTRGASTYQLALWHKVRRNTVRDLLRRNGIQLSEGNTIKLSPELREAIRTERSAGVTIRALCFEFEVTESTIKRSLRVEKRSPIHG